jgi:outer membrane protein TolC
VAGIEGRQYSGDGNFREGMFTVGLSLPWLNRSHYRSEVARDRARLEAAQLDRASEELRVREEVHGLFIQIDAALNRLINR